MPALTPEHLATLHGHVAELAISDAVNAAGGIPEGYEIDLFNGQYPDWGWICQTSEQWGFISLEDAVNGARAHAAGVYSATCEAVNAEGRQCEKKADHADKHFAEDGYWDRSEPCQH